MKHFFNFLMYISTKKLQRSLPPTPPIRWHPRTSTFIHTTLLNMVQNYKKEERKIYQKTRICSSFRPEWRERQQVVSLHYRSTHRVLESAAKTAVGAAVAPAFAAGQCVRARDPEPAGTLPAGLQLGSRLVPIAQSQRCSAARQPQCRACT